jgi:hypothetical protein
MSTATLETRINKAIKRYEKKNKVTPTEAELVMLLREVLECDVCPPGTLVKLGLMEQTQPVAEDFEGKLMESQVDGFCTECGVPYAEGETIFWLGPGRGAMCSGCSP